MSTDQRSSAEAPEPVRPEIPSIRRTVKWPPKVIRQLGLGDLEDTGGMILATDIGRSTKLSNGQVAFQFGDTFFRCPHMSGDSSDGTRSIVTSSSEATSVESVNVHGDCRMILHNGLTLVPNHRTPCVSTYPYGRQLSSDGKRLRALLRPLEEYDRIWSFSGIVESQRKRLEDGSENIRGYVWYETRKFGPELKIEDGYYANSGVAEICFNFPLLQDPYQTMATSVFVLGQKELFQNHESRFGTFCSLAIGAWAYCYGHLAFPPRHCPKVSKDVGLARVPIAKVNERENYQYWNGKTWTRDIKDVKPVFTDMQHGQIFPSEMFWPEYPWAFFGCNSFGDSKAILGRGKAPEGPWEWQTIEGLKAYAKISRPKGSFCYCFYPHPWASDTSAAELMVTWCEGGLAGNIIAERIKFETV